MKNTFTIFWEDLKRLVHSPFALAIAIGLCFLPSLYAWFNIYSNWDPYANTGNIQIAIASDDEGFTLDDGTYKNIGADVLAELETNESIDWVVLNSTKEAVKGVETGKYYACVTLDKDFTRNMYDVLNTGFKRPTINYHENEKKNAVATKITDTAVGTLQTNISKKYIAAVVTTVFQKTNEASENVEEEDPTGTMRDKFEKLRDNLVNYNDLITQLLAGNDDLIDEIDDATKEINELIIGINKASDNLTTAQGDFDKSQQALEQYNVQVKATLIDVSNTLGNISNELRTATVADDVQAAVNSLSQLSSDVSKLKSQLTTLQGLVLSDSNIDNQTQVQVYLKIMETTMSQLYDIISQLQAQSALNGTSTAKQINNALSAAADSVDAAKAQVDTLYINYTTQLEPQLRSLLNSIADVMENVNNVMQNMSITLEDTNQILGNVSVTVTETNATFEKMQIIIEETIKELDSIIEWMDTTSESDKIEMVTNFLSGDAESYGDFIASPVTIQTEQIYGVDTYGSAMTPFYTILSLWVGGTILVSLVKVHAKAPAGLKEVKPHHLFFGRYLMFFVLGQLQAIIVVLGDIFLLKCQIQEPILFLVVAMMASLTFTLLIYSLAISFGDVGKALAVVVMVIQIAGSSGTFPIELLPSVYQNIYIFFPFPYAINAMRETVAGMYETAYVDNLSKLLIFMAVALVIGLVVRVPFIHLNHYVEERMEDTGFM